MIGKADVDRRLRALLVAGNVGDLTDGQLLGRFAAGPGAEAELAFATLVERHGGMVLGVARGILADPHDAQDAFQATFLVLVARAPGLRARDTIGPWLHQVARRTALCQRAAIARRRRLDRHAAVSEVASRPAALDDLGRVLHEEIGRLPEHFRAPVVLCDLEGRTHEQAARDLGWPVGTVKSRQARARDRLRDRLARRGVAPAPLLLAPRPTLPATLIDNTAAAARHFAPRAFAPGAAAALAREVIGTMTLLHWGKLGSTLLALAVAASGAGLITQNPGDQPGAATGPAPTSAPAPLPPPDGPPTVEVRPGKLGFTLTERGAVEPARPYALINEVEGNQVISKILPDGSKVREGDVVAELESGNLRDAIINQRIALSKAEVAYREAVLTREVAEFAIKEYVEGVARQDLADLKSKVAQGEAAAVRGQARLDRIRRARERLKDAAQKRVGPEAPADILADLDVADRLDAAEAGLDASKVDADAARGRLATFEQYTKGRQIKSLQQDVEKARQRELELQSAWKLQETKLAKVERQVKACVIRAPVDGTLVLPDDPNARPGTPQVEAGATVRERQLLGQVYAASDPMRINAKVRESWVDQVRVGTAVRVRVDALPNEVLTGVVRSVAPMADTATFRAEQRKVYTTYVQLDAGTAGKLRAGMVARVDIPIFELDDVLSVPVDAVASTPGLDRVRVLAPDGSTAWRPVTLGRSNGESVEVKDGLRPGDRVLLNAPAAPPAHPAGPK